MSVPYGGEDPANGAPEWGWTHAERDAHCWCGEANGLFLIGDKFFCAQHRPKESR